MVNGFKRTVRKKLMGARMTKEQTVPIRLPEDFRDLIDNIRATRRSKAFSIDKKMLTQGQTCRLITEFFKAENESFSKLIKFRSVKYVR